jgi:hypothetical protein
MHSMEACAWIHQAQDRSWRPCVCVLPMRPCVHHRRMCTTLAGFPEMATSIAGWEAFQRWRLQSPEGPLHQGSAIQDALSIKFSKTGRYRVPSTLARRQQFSWRRIHRNLSPRGLRTAVATTTSRPPRLLQAGRKSRRRRGLGRSSKDLNRRSCPDYPARRGD